MKNNIIKKKQDFVQEKNKYILFLLLQDRGIKKAKQLLGREYLDF